MNAYASVVVVSVTYTYLHKNYAMDFFCCSPGPLKASG